jgi:hypothetical protein
MTYPEAMPDEIMRLADGLLQATINKRIGWISTDRSDQFLYASAKSSALIRKANTKLADGKSDAYELQILNSGGSVITQLRSGGRLDLKSKFVPAIQNELLEHLYQAARSNALDIANALNDMFGSLDLRPPEPR